MHDCETATLYVPSCHSYHFTLIFVEVWLNVSVETTQISVVQIFQISRSQP